MEITNKNVKPHETQPENEAIKNTEDINADKIHKQAVSDEDLPGYPHYPAEEDMLNPSNTMERVDADVEFITRAGNLSEADMPTGNSLSPVNDMELPVADDMDDEDDLQIVPGTEADVTKEYLLLLGPKDQDMDMGEDEELQNKGFPLGVTGADLDTPGEELDDMNEDIGEEDEENNYYSLGGDNKD